MVVSHLVLAHTTGPQVVGHLEGRQEKSRGGTAHGQVSKDCMEYWECQPNTKMSATRRQRNCGHGWTKIETLLLKMEKDRGGVETNRIHHCCRVDWC